MESPDPSTLRLCATGDRGVWQVGADKILKEYPSDDALCTEGAVMRLLAQDPEIPTPRVLHEWVDSNGRFLILEERLRGETLQDAWLRLSQPQKRAIAAQVGQVRHVDPDDAKGKELLLQQFEAQEDGHPDTVQFCDSIFLLKGYPYLHDGERELLAKLCSGPDMKRRSEMVLDNS